MAGGHMTMDLRMLTGQRQDLDAEAKEVNRRSSTAHARILHFQPYRYCLSNESSFLPCTLVPDKTYSYSTLQVLQQEVE
jgi:hypothetical protein